MAKADVLKIDMNSVITLKDFKRLVENNFSFIMFITVNSTKYSYECKYEYETVNFLSENRKPFLSLTFEGDGLIQITGLKFKKIKSLTPLDTTFYLRTFFYRMVKIDKFKIVDHAIVSCKDKDKDRIEEYRALLYRLFATDTPLWDLSIYYKYFTKITLDNNNHLNLQKLLKEYRSVDAFPVLTELTDFFDKPDCSVKARLLNDHYKTLRRNGPEFQKFYNALSYFSVKTTDSIYYPCCKDCNGLFCLNKNYLLQRHLDESRQFLFRRNVRRIKSKSLSKKKQGAFQI